MNNPQPPAESRTDYIGVAVIPNGYHPASRVTLYLCRAPDGTVWGVHAHGYITYADPAHGIPPLHTLRGGTIDYVPASPPAELGAVFTAYEGANLPDTYADRDVPPSQGGPVDHGFRLADDLTLCGRPLSGLDINGDEFDAPGDDDLWTPEGFASCEDCEEALEDDIRDAMEGLGYALTPMGGGLRAWTLDRPHHGDTLIISAHGSYAYDNPGARVWIIARQGRGFTQSAPFTLAEAVELVATLPHPATYPDTDWQRIPARQDSGDLNERRGWLRTR